MSETRFNPPECPPAGELAAYADGRLDAESRRRIAEHLLACSECYEVLCGAAAVLEEVEATAPKAPVRPFPFRRVVTLAAAAVLVMAVVAIPLIRRGVSRRAAPMAQLAAAIAPGRPFEGRVAEFDYAPPRNAVRGETAPSYETLAAAAQVERETAGKDDPASLRALAIAHLVTGRAADAVALLERSAAGAPSPGTWSDLSAAYLERGRRRSAPADFVLAYEAAERALLLDPRFAPAAFNGALALEAQQFLSDEAAAAWERYLAIDSSSRWAEEARRHRDALRRRGTAPSAADRRRAIETAAERGDWSELGRLASSAPQEARVVAEEVALPRWAAAVLAGAPAELRDVDVIAQALAARGDSGVTKMAAAIGSASAAQRTAIARGLAALAGARTAYRDGRFEDALEQLAAAKGNLPAPFSSDAALLEASALYVRRDLDAAARVLAGDDALHAAGTPSLTGRMEWVSGLVSITSGHPFEGLRSLRSAAVRLEQIGEVENAAGARGLAADALQFLGETAESWSERLQAARELVAAAPSAQRWHVALFDLAEEAHRRGEEHTALLVSSSVASRAFAERHAERAVDALQVRAAAAASLGRLADAEKDLEEAARWAAKIDDPRARERTLLSLDSGAAESFVSSAPEKAQRFAETALRRAEGLGDRTFLAELRLLHGRLLRRAGRTAEAEVELQRGLGTIEEASRSITDDAIRVAHHDTAAALVDELTGLLAQQGRSEEAWALVARTRGLEMRRRLGFDEPKAVTAAALPRGDALVLTYAVLDGETLVWSDDGRHRSMHRIGLGREDLARRVAALREAGADRGAAGALYELLVEPAVADSPRNAPLVIVPDESLHELPFAALWDARSGRYLVETRRLSFAISPSGARRARAGAIRTALVIGNPAVDLSLSDELTPLAAAEGEAREVASVYPGATLLLGSEPTPEQVRAALPSCDVVHFAGHATAGNSDPGSSAVFLARGSGSGVLYARDVASLKLDGVRLFVLAGCGTAQGRIFSLEGVRGFAQAALAAGAQEVVATVGALPDAASAYLFPRFHREVRAGTPAAEALRATQVAMIHSGDPALSAPSAWGRVEVITASP